MKPNLARARIPLLAVGCALLFMAQVHWRPGQFALLAEARPSAPAEIQLRYNRGYGIRQEGISTHLLDATGQFVSVRFPIEVNNAKDLRLVNLGAGRSLELRSLILKPLFESPRRLTSADLSSPTPNTEIKQEGDIIRVESSGTGPTVLQLVIGSELKASRVARVLQWIPVIPLFCCAGALLASFRQEKKPGDQTSGGPWPNEPRRLRRMVIGALVLGYFSASLLGLNGSSTALWHSYADLGLPNVGLIAGSAQKVRSDEWMLQTPWIFSQASRLPAFSPSNPTLGSDVTPLVTNLPVRHWSTLFRPQMWPFFLLNPERAFVFYWNFKSFSLLLGAFLFFGVLTRGNTWLDLAGALFLTFSPYVQWWLSTPTCLPEMLAMLFFALWLFAIIFWARKRWEVVAAAVALVVVVENFIFCCYPRFQVPLVYLAVALLLFGGIARAREDLFRTFRLCGIAFVMAAVTVLTWFWWRDVAEIIRITSQLSYPGQVRFTGGDFDWHRCFAPFLEFNMTGDRFPERLENACEAAGFLLIAPLLALPAMRDAWRGRPDRVLIVSLGLVAFALLYMMVGIPAWAARISGWSYVSSVRANVLVGVATAIALVAYLGRAQEMAVTPLRWWIFAGSVLAFLAVLSPTNRWLEHFETWGTIVATALLFGLIAACLWMRSIVATCVLLIVPQFYACAFVNPVSRGVPGITQSGLLRWLAESETNKPAGKWIVLGETLRAQVLPDFLKAAGLDVLGGMRCNPDREMLKILDPTGKYAAVTNQYAWIHFHQADVEAPIFEGDALVYDIKMRLSGDLLDQLAVKHILEVDRLDGEVPPGFHVVGTRDRCRLLERD